MTWLLRRQNSGHLVVVSSFSAVRGLPKHLTVYAASKARLAHPAEGIRAELLGTPIRVTTLFPGYIRTELNEGAGRLPFEVDEATGSRAMVRAIEREPAAALKARPPIPRDLKPLRVRRLASVTMRGWRPSRLQSRRLNVSRGAEPKCG